jgi:DNA-binding MarR family transcriptional regulator
MMAKRAERKGCIEKPAALQPPTLAQEIGKKKAFEHPEEEAFLNLLRTAGMFTCDTNRFFKSYHLSEPSYNALRILRGHHPTGVPSQTIGQMLVAQVPDVTRLVDRLVEQGLAERGRVEGDRRVVMVKITKAGMELLSKIDGPLLELHRMQLGHMSRGELKELNRLLVKCRCRE